MGEVLVVYFEDVHLGRERKRREEKFKKRKEDCFSHLEVLGNSFQLFRIVKFGSSVKGHIAYYAKLYKYKGLYCIIRNMFPTEILESKAQRKILRVLAEKNKQYTLDEIAEMCHRSKSTISRSLKDSEKYPFIKKKHLPGSKELVVGLNPESKYSEAIRLFFNEERNRERQNGTIPVDIWNLLEDLTDLLSRIDDFVELFLFGSYATGEYHAKSDIDLILLHTSEKNVAKKIDSITESVKDKEVQVIPVKIDQAKLDKVSDQDIVQYMRERSPVNKVDTLISLSGKVSV